LGNIKNDKGPLRECKRDKKEVKKYNRAKGSLEGI
jgi:hypothetical protein